MTTFSFARELWGSDASGLLALTLWCFSPNILGYAGLVTPDGAATSFGLLATYLFWRWLKKPDWKRATLAGLALGLAEVSKSSWIILFGLWPLLTVFWLLTDSSLRTSRATWLRMSGQLTAVLAIGLYMLNAAYLFDGTGTRLGEFEFVSATLAGEEFAGEGRNRFHGTPFADIPMPLPRQYICGIDVQKRDLESYGQPSYLC
ncbi:MAG: glycosyltransferase family 39 protein, partial [Planctomycetota bacterium]